MFGAWKKSQTRYNDGAGMVEAMLVNGQVDFRRVIGAD